MSDVATAYSSSAGVWQHGPARVYDRLAEVLADRSPVPLAGGLVLDLGAGTGAASLAAARLGAHVIAVDVAIPMLSATKAAGVRAVAGDAQALPFAKNCFDVVIAAFSLNHLPDPAPGLREAARVLRPGGGLVVGAFAADDTHPAREVVDSVATAHGWAPPEWHAALQANATPLLATVDRSAAVAKSVGLGDVVVTNVRVPFPALAVRDLVEWRLGMAHLAPFVATLSPDQRRHLVTDACDRLTGAPDLVRSVIVLTGRAAA